jgi:hypothetical protein
MVGGASHLAWDLGVETVMHHQWGKQTRGKGDALHFNQGENISEGKVMHHRSWEGRPRHHIERPRGEVMHYKVKEGGSD